MERLRPVMGMNSAPPLCSPGGCAAVLPAEVCLCLLLPGRRLWLRDVSSSSLGSACMSTTAQHLSLRGVGAGGPRLPRPSSTLRPGACFSPDIIMVGVQREPQVRRTLSKRQLVRITDKGQLLHRQTGLSVVCRNVCVIVSCVFTLCLCHDWD